MHLLKLFTRVQPTTSRLPLSLNPTQLRALARLTNNAPRSAQNVKQDLYWTKIPGWENVDSSEFISYRFQVCHVCSFQSLPNRIISLETLSLLLHNSNGSSKRYFQTFWGRLPITGYKALGPDMISFKMPLQGSIPRP